MRNIPQKSEKPAKKNAGKLSGKQFFTVPEKKSAEWAGADFKMKLGGLPLETKAGFDLISYRLRRLLTGAPESWQEIEREEHGSFFMLFRKYHLPLMLPFFALFICREIWHFTNIVLFLKHVVLMLPIATGIYATYIFLSGVIAEETAEYSGGRFSPQSGMRIALFSSMIMSFFSVAIFLPVLGFPLLVMGIIWHYVQLMSGARALLNLSDANYRLYRLSHFLVWIFLGLSAFVVLSLVSFVFAKLGFVAI